jgi:hypothetical protein
MNRNNHTFHKEIAVAKKRQLDMIASNKGAGGVLRE